MLLSFAGALVATYFLSFADKLLLRKFWRSRGWTLLALAHGGSLVILMVLVGVWQNYFRAFALDRATIFILPQVIWLVVDWLRGKGD